MKHRYKITMYVDSTDIDPRKVKRDVDIHMNASIVGEMGHIKNVCKILAIPAEDEAGVWFDAKKQKPRMGELVNVVSGIAVGFMRYIEPSDFERNEVDYWSRIAENPNVKKYLKS